jgi:hypothetical protein
MFGFVFGKDPTDPAHSIKRFAPQAVIADYIDEWTNPLNNIIFVAKSRRVSCTWVNCALFYWDSIRHESRFTFMQSRELGDAGLDRDYALLWRVKFIHEHLPEHLRPAIKLKKRLQMLELPDTGASFMAISADFDGFRQYPGTGVYADELATQAHGGAGFLAAIPTLEGHGKYVASTTPNGREFFYRKVNDLE